MVDRNHFYKNKLINKDYILKPVIKHVFYVAKFGGTNKNDTFAIVFFIVLDLRLTRLEQGVAPFFMPVCQRGPSYLKSYLKKKG